MASVQTAPRNKTYISGRCYFHTQSVGSVVPRAKSGPDDSSDDGSEKSPFWVPMGTPAKSGHDDGSESTASGPQLTGRSSGTPRSPQLTGRSSEAPRSPSPPHSPKDVLLSPSSELRAPLSALADLPSIGSQGHAKGQCRPCLFHAKGACSSGHDCRFCHFDHVAEKSKRKSLDGQRRRKRKSVGDHCKQPVVVPPPPGLGGSTCCAAPLAAPVAPQLSHPPLSMPEAPVVPQLSHPPLSMPKALVVPHLSHMPVSTPEAPQSPTYCGGYPIPMPPLMNSVEHFPHSPPYAGSGPCHLPMEAPQTSYTGVAMQMMAPQGFASQEKTTVAVQMDPSQGLPPAPPSYKAPELASHLVPAPPIQNPGEWSEARSDLFKLAQELSTDSDQRTADDSEPFWPMATPRLRLDSDDDNIFDATATDSSPPMVSWSIERVAEWLATLGLGHLSGLFRTHRISGDVLPELSNADLVEMSIHAVGDRKKLLRAVQEDLVSSSTGLSSGYPHPQSPSQQPQSPGQMQFQLTSTWYAECGGPQSSSFTPRNSIPQTGDCMDVVKLRQPRRRHRRQTMH